MATENSGAPHLPPSWPEVPTSWPETQQDPVPTSWPESNAARSAWTETPYGDTSQPGWPEAPRHGQPQQDQARHDTGRQEQPPVPAWSEPPPPAQPAGGAWANLSSPAPWPGANSNPAPWNDPRPGNDPMAAARPAAADPLTGPLPQGDPLNDPLNGPRPSNDPLGGPRPANDGRRPTGDPLNDAWPSNAPTSGAWPSNAPASGGWPANAPGPGPAGGPGPANGPGPMGDPLSGPWPAADPQHGAPMGGHQPMGDPLSGPMPGSPPAGNPLDRTVTLNQAYAPQAPVADPGHPNEPRPGANLSRDPSDPDKPFVTAGQVSGSRTPPPERQQELWDTVFGDGEDDGFDDEPGKPIWIYALGGSVAVALVLALVWAFVAGPLASEPEPTTSPGPKASAPATKPAAKSPARLPKYPGKAAPVTGTLPDTTAGISVPRLGGTWQLDTRATMRTTYGYATRQYVAAGTDAAGEQVFAHVMTGPLAPRLASHYTSPDNLEPVIKAVVVSARKKFFPEGNTIRKTGQQMLKVGDAPAKVNAYEVTAGEVKTMVVAAAVSTGADVPAIVYMSVPSAEKDLLPNINTIFRQIKLTS
ncbi:hypothetical protein [Nonomuraea sp. NPDC046570]|uniref:hypothetical protein n=1 Tax=Nonomuraea sp. NPDC046570 TaxID=3155255 RepID=UPI003403D916